LNIELLGTAWKSGQDLVKLPYKLASAVLLQVDIHGMLSSETIPFLLFDCSYWKKTGIDHISLIQRLFGIGFRFWNYWLPYIFIRSCVLFYTLSQDIISYSLVLLQLSRLIIIFSFLTEIYPNRANYALSISEILKKIIDFRRCF